MIAPGGLLPGNGPIGFTGMLNAGLAPPGVTGEEGAVAGGDPVAGSDGVEVVSSSSSSPGRSSSTLT